MLTCFFLALAVFFWVIATADDAPPADDDYSATTVNRHSHQRGRT